MAGQFTAAADPEAHCARAALPLLPPILADPAAVPRQADWCEPAELHVEMQQPAPWAARTLNLPASHLATTICVRFSDPATGTPAALTTALLRPDLFRVVICAGEPPLPGGGLTGLPAAWEYVPADWA